MDRVSAVHLTSVHPRYDTRIFVKQCRSLAAHGHLVSLVVADGQGDEVKDGVRVLDAGKLPGRLNRIFRTTRRVMQRAVDLDADLYHLHDPELLPVGLALKRLGKRVIFDAHEDVPLQLLGKPYLGPRRLRALSATFASFERHACRRLDGVVAATPFIARKFGAINARTVEVGNYPILDEFIAPTLPQGQRAEVCYVGGIEAARGIRETVAALERVTTPVRLNLAGRFADPALAAGMKAAKGWSRVNELGHLDRLGVRDVLHGSVAGLVTLHPIVNYLDALPVKMFEYMAAGIPVIASDFPLWRSIVEGHQCGLCVDPLDPIAIAAAIDHVIAHPQEAARMGANGRRAVREKYNWAIEETKLLRFYGEVLAC